MPDGSTANRRHTNANHFESNPNRNCGTKIAPLLDNAVAALKEKDRQRVLLRFYEGKNLQEIGTRLGVSEVAVEKRVESHR